MLDLEEGRMGVGGRRGGGREEGGYGYVAVVGRFGPDGGFGGGDGLPGGVLWWYGGLDMVKRFGEKGGEDWVEEF